MKTYLTPITSVVVHESGWYRLGPVEVTCVPLVDADTFLFARLDTRRATVAAAALGARLVSRDTIRRLTKEALSLGTCIDPVILPDAEMRRLDPPQPGELVKAYETRIRRNMASFEWAKTHDLECWKRLEALNWNRSVVTGNVGKWLSAGAPPGRCYLMGWWDKKAGRFIQPGTDSGPGPHAGGIITAAGVEVPGQHDYATLTVLERDVVAK